MAKKKMRQEDYDVKPSIDIGFLVVGIIIALIMFVYHPFICL